MPGSLASAENALKRIQKTPAVLQEVLSWLDGRREEIAAQDEFTHEHRRALIDEAKAEALAAVSQIGPGLAEDRQHIEEWVADRENAARGTGADAELLTVMTEGRGWDRAQKLLAARMSLPEVIEQGGRTGDVDMLSGIRRELDAHYAAEANRSGVDFESIEPGIAAVRRRLDALLSPLVDPKLAEARRFADALADAMPLAEVELANTQSRLVGRGTSALGGAIARHYAVAGVQARQLAATQPRAGSLGDAIAEHFRKAGAS